MRRTTPILVAVLLVPSCASLGEVPMAAVPDDVMNAAREALPTIEVKRVSREWDWWRPIYEVEGTVGTTRYEIEVTKRGKVIEIEDGADD